jgi:hypothetical protein
VTKPANAPDPNVITFQPYLFNTWISSTCARRSLSCPRYGVTRRPAARQIFARRIRTEIAPRHQSTRQTAHLAHQAVPARLPAIEVVPAGAFAAAEGKSNQPHNCDKNRGNPQEMHCESGAEQEQSEQQCEYQYHATRFPNSGSHKPVPHDGVVIDDQLRAATQKNPHGCFAMTV